jgi:flagellar hook-associated protein 2
VGELKDLIQSAVGSGASVELGPDGKFVVTAAETGSSLLELTISSDNEGGGSLQLATEVTQDGRAAASIDASLESGALRLTHQDYGSAAGFRVEFTNAATGTELGLGASGTESTGTDVAGTIGGLAATGSGRVLTGASDTSAEGLSVKVTDAFTGGSVMFSRGIASQLSLLLDGLMGTEHGSVRSVLDGLDERVASLGDHVDEMDARLARRQEDLVRRFTAMEQAMAVAQNQSAWIASQIGSLPTYSSSNG